MVYFITILVLLFPCFVFLIYYFFSSRKKISDLEKKSKVNIDESLELATAKQLLKEMRKRTNIPFVLLLPIKEKDFNGLTIETHSMSSSACLAVVHLAKAIITHNFRVKGDSIPQLPPLDDYLA